MLSLRPGHGASRSRRGRGWIAGLLAITSLGAAQPALAQTLAAGFQETVVAQGLVEPTAVRFAGNGQTFVAEKSGIVKVFAALDGSPPIQVIDLRPQVHSFWDRGLLGLAVHPSYPATPHLYVLYAHDVYPPPSLGGPPSFPTGPRWGTGGANPSTSDPCPNPPGATDDGCVVFGRLSRIVIDTQTLQGTEVPLIEAQWCQQYPSHSVGDLVFGDDGHLYASAGDGASFTFADYGQDGSPLNPCGDPPTGVGGTQTSPSAEGGALRSQGWIGSAVPAPLSGSILRIDADNVAGLISDPTPFIVAHGLRNPFRINRRPGTNEIWISDVGWNVWEEINRLADPADGVPDNFGWPCYAGDDTGVNGTHNRQSAYAGLALCQTLYTSPSLPSIATAPYYAYLHSAQVVPGETCGTGSSAITGIAFYENGSNYPPEFTDALFFADSSRNCIWAMRADANGDPDPSSIQPLVANTSGRPVDLQIGHGGALYYVDFNNGRVFRMDFFPANQPPAAVIQAAPTAGLAPLTVQLDGSGSSDPEDGSNLLYDWDLDGDGSFGDSFLAGPQVTFTQAGVHIVRLRVEDTQGATGEAQLAITADNAPPVPVIHTPLETQTWTVGEALSYDGSASDPQDGVLPPTQLDWEMILHHCITPSDCHTHPVTATQGVSGGSFDAPDHEFPSFLELKLTATDLPPADWLDPAWSERVKLDLDNSAQTETLVDVPVLVRFDPTRIDYTKTGPGGQDLRFTDATGVVLSHEVERWDPTGDSWVWVKVPQIAGGATSDSLYAYYGNPAAGPAEDPAGVFSNGYAAVWHLHDDFLDSTLQANDLLNVGSLDVPGKVGDGQWFDGSTSYLDAGSSPSLEVTGQLTLEAWITLADPTQAGSPRVLSKKNVWTDPVGYNLEYNPTGLSVTTLGSGSDFIRADGVDLGTGWHYLATTVNGGAGRVYVDGIDRTTDGTLSPLAADSQALTIGRQSGGGAFFLGAIDEVRISNLERSPDWIAFQLLSMTDQVVGFNPPETPATLSASTSVFIQPQSVDLSFDSTPSGLDLVVGPDLETTPFARTLIVGSNNSVTAPSPQQSGPAVFEFDTWSDGGAASHNIIAPAAPETLTANYALVPACSDGIDNDGDLLVDLADPGCGNRPGRGIENPACSDGIDNDGDLLVDLADPHCTSEADTREAAPTGGCGLGFEAALALALLALQRARARRR